MKFERAYQFISVLLMMNLWLASTLMAETLNIVYTHENKAFGDLLKKFETQTEHKLNVVWIDQSDLKSRMVGLLSIKDVPDVLIVPADNLGMAEYSGLSRIPDALITGNISNKALATVTLHGEMLGIPIVQGNHLLLYYNKAFIKQPAKSWEQLIEQQSIIPPDVKLISWSFMEMYWFIPFITAFGELPVIEDLPHLDSDSVRNALEYVWQLSNNEIVDQRCNYSCAEKRFLSSKSAYSINGIWAYQTYKTALDNNLGVVALPALKGKAMKPYFSTIVATFPKDSLSSVKKEAVRAFARFIQSESFQQSLWTTLREIPSNQTVLDQIKLNTTAEYKVLLETLETTLPMSSHRNMAIIWEVILKGYLRYGSGIWDAEKTTAYMQSLAMEHINRTQLKEAQ